MNPSLSLPRTAPRTLHDLPSPPALPLIGHLHRLDPTRMHLQLEAWAREFGGAYRLRLANRDVLVFDDPELAHAVLRDRPKTISRAGMIRPIFAELGIDGVFAAEGDDWLPQRRLIMQSLNVTHFRSFFPTIQRITARLLRRWQRAAERGEVLEMTQELIRYTVDVTSALSFGEDPNTIEQPGNVIQDHLASIFPAIMKRTMMPFPLWHWLKLPADRRLDRDLKVVHAYAHERIARARERLRDDPAEGPRNALEAMLLEVDRPGSGFDDRSVVANVLTLLLGGEDTTAHSLAWTLLYLAQDPALQRRLHAQACLALGDDAVCAAHEQVRELDAFEALATEAMRLRPVVAFLGLEAREPTEVGGIHLPVGTRLFFLNRPAQVDERRFARPQVYDPSRWSRAVAPADGAHDARAFLQFGAGPRVCPGRHLAGVEMRLVLSMLLKHFEVELACRPDEIEELLHFTLTPSRMPVRLRLRRNAAPAPRAAAKPARSCPFGHG
ncbi:cytochrome P450 [Aquabacterium humicola]|uniref:cytochrome P450 n=1 Tax=Aquabacterium humicola TaxID=3237377 RepID=UPI0025434B63|nr:cytochrome P450 [Rubrivivax pictus]